MPYRILADAVVFVHFGFILFVAAGALLAWRWPRVAVAHLPALAWAVGTVAIGFPCPLTALEKTLRRWGDAQPYEGGFVDHYIEDVIYPDQYSGSLRALALLLIVTGYYGARRAAGRGRLGGGQRPRLSRHAPRLL